MAQNFHKDLDDGTRTFIVVSDVHVPYHDVACTDAVAELAHDIKPDGFVIAGDFLDLEEVSSHNAGSLRKLEGKRIKDTFDAGNALLTQWDRAAGPQCAAKDFLDGNHEDRLSRWLSRGDNGVFEGDDSVDIGHRLHLRERGWRYHSAKGDEPASIHLTPHLLVIHGEYTNKYHAAKHLDETRKSVIYGHTHAPQVFTGPSWDSQQVAVGLGFLGQENAPCFTYKRKPRRWLQGFAVVHTHSDGTFNITPLNFWNGRFVYGERAYGRRPISMIQKMARARKVRAVKREMARARKRAA